MQTYTLAICENELIQAKFIQKILADYAAERGIQFHLPIFESAEAFLFEYAENKAVDLLFLDIQMEELDGVALAEKNSRDSRPIKNCLYYRNDRTYRRRLPCFC